MKIATIRSAAGAFKTVEGVVYTLEVSPPFGGSGPDRRVWDGGALGGRVVEYLDNRGGLLHFHVYGGSSVPHSFGVTQFVKAALYAQKRRRADYEAAKATVAAYEAALAQHEAV